MEFEDQLKHINSINFTKESIKAAGTFLKTKKETDDTPAWAVKYQEHLQKGKNGLELFGRLIVPKENRERVIRSELLSKSSTMPFGVRSGYHRLIQKYVGITVRFFWDFMMKQEPIRRTDSRAPAKKNRGHITAKKLGMIECDLIEVTYRDLGMKAPKKAAAKPEPKKAPVKKKNPTLAIPKKKGVKRKEPAPDPIAPKVDKVNEKTLFFIFSAVDRVTGLTYLEFSRTKTMVAIGRILENSFRFYSKALKVPIKSLRYFSDRGSEFGFTAKKEETYFYKHGVINKWVDKGAIIENRNSYIQKVFHRIRGLQRKESFQVMVKRTMRIVNETKNKNHGKSPAQVVRIIKEGNSNEIRDFIKNYNSGKRAKEVDTKSKQKPINVGDRVRLLVVKRGKSVPLGYKSYRGQAYTEQTFEVLATTKKPPVRYKIKLKGKPVWKTRDAILKTAEYDQTTSRYLKMIKNADERRKEKDKIDALAKEVAEERAKFTKRNTGGRRRPHPTVFPRFIDRETRQVIKKIHNNAQLEKLRKRYVIPRDKLKGKVMYISKIK